MNLIQPFASRVPYMAGVGNHESGGSNRKHFAMRFAGMQHVGEASNASNAGSIDHGDQMWWSFDAGLIHWIAVDTELWNCAHMQPHGDNSSFWSSVWNPKTDRALVDEFIPWLEADLDKVREPLWGNSRGTLHCPHPISAGAFGYLFLSRATYVLTAPFLNGLQANANRANVPWVVGFAHKGWYMQPEVNFSMIDDVLHKGGADLFFAGHIHIYQRYFPLRTSPYGNNASHPNNVPADVDFDCASSLGGPDYDHDGLIGNRGSKMLTSASFHALNQCNLSRLFVFYTRRM